MTHRSLNRNMVVFSSIKRFMPILRKAVIEPVPYLRQVVWEPLPILRQVVWELLPILRQAVWETLSILRQAVWKQLSENHWSSKIVKFSFPHTWSEKGLFSCQPEYLPRLRYRLFSPLYAYLRYIFKRLFGRARCIFKGLYLYAYICVR